MNMPIRNGNQKKTQDNATQRSITDRLTDAGIKVQSGKRIPKKGEYSGIISNSKKVLKLNV